MSSDEVDREMLADSGSLVGEVEPTIALKKK